MVSFPGWINFLPGNCIWEICRLSAHNWTGCFSLQVPNHYSWVKNSLSLPCKDWSDLYINDVVINQSDRLLERSAHINNLWYLSNIPPCSGLQNELFFFFTVPAWMWNSLKSRLFTFGFVTVRCYCFIPEKKLLWQSCFSFLSVLPLGHCLLLEEFFF